MVAPILCISERWQNWQNGGKLEQFKAMDKIISRCEVWGKSVVVAVTLFSPFHIMRYGSDVYLGLSLIENGGSYLEYRI